MSELGPPRVPAAPAAFGDLGLVRAWAVIALLLVATAPLGALYDASFHWRSTGAPLGSPLGEAILFDVGLAIMLGMPTAFFGLRLARPLGWGAPFLAGVRPAREAPFALSLAILLGMAASLAMIGAGIAVHGLFPHALSFHDHDLVGPTPGIGALGAVEAGVDEETLTRLFLVSLVARFFQALRGCSGPPPGAVKWTAIVLAALAFGALHFTNMSAFRDPFTLANMGYVVFGNAILGVTCGWLFTRHGIESAMAAHFAAGFVGHGVFPQLLRMHGIAVLS